MSSLSDLIARVEKASGASREIDALIFCTMSGCYDWKYAVEHCDAYTASIDAALTLLPEGWEWQVSNRAPEPNAGRAYLHNGELIFSGFGGSQRNPAHKFTEVVASTPALALVAACLKAHLLDAASSEAR